MVSQYNNKNLQWFTLKNWSSRPSVNFEWVVENCIYKVSHIYCNKKNKREYDIQCLKYFKTCANNTQGYKHINYKHFQRSYPHPVIMSSLELGVINLQRYTFLSTPRSYGHSLIRCTFSFCRASHHIYCASFDRFITNSNILKISSTQAVQCFPLHLLIINTRVDLGFKWAGAKY